MNNGAVRLHYSFVEEHMNNKASNMNQNNNHRRFKKCEKLPMISIKNIWEFSTAVPDEIECMGARIVFWKLLHKDDNYMDLSDPYVIDERLSRDTNIWRIMNKKGSFFIRFGEKTIKDRCKTIRNISHKNMFMETAYNYDTIFNELLDLNKDDIEHFKSVFISVYKRDPVELDNKDNYCFQIENFGPHISFKLSFMMFDEDIDEEVKIIEFENYLKIDLRKTECEKYIKAVANTAYFCKFQYIDSYEIWTDSKYLQDILDIASDIQFSYKDPFQDDTKKLVRFLDYGIPADFLSKFVPDEMVFEIQVLYRDQDKYNHYYGPTYVNSAIV